MLKPVGKRMLVKPVEIKQGTLIVSGQKPVQFHVVSIGDEVTKVAVGDTIYLEKHYGLEIEHEKEKFLVVDEHSVLAKLD
jgi:co-chaperonin GroES (HSP10)